MWYTSRNSPLSHLQFHIYTFDACQAPWTPLLLQVMQSSSASPENWRREAKPNLRRSWAISHFNIFCKIQRPARDFFSHQPFKSWKSSIDVGVSFGFFRILHLSQGASAHTTRQLCRATKETEGESIEHWRSRSKTPTLRWHHGKGRVNGWWMMTWMNVLAFCLWTFKRRKALVIVKWLQTLHH